MHSYLPNKVINNFFQYFTILYVFINNIYIKAI